MMDVLKPCPFCGTKAKAPVADHASCPNVGGCPISSMVMFAHIWNHRPIENALRNFAVEALQQDHDLLWKNYLAALTKIGELEYLRTLAREKKV